MLSDSYYLIAIQLFSMFGCVWQPLINEHDDVDDEQASSCAASLYDVNVSGSDLVLAK